MMRRFWMVVFCVLSTACAIAFEAFKARSLRYEGRVFVPEKLLNDLIAWKPGLQVDARLTRTIIQKIYETGLVRTVRLSRDRDVLVIELEENPVLGRIEVSGNRHLGKEDIINGLKQQGIVTGRPVREGSLSRFRLWLQNRYRVQGYRSVRVDFDTTTMGTNGTQKALAIRIVEGSPIRLGRIVFKGVHSVPAWVLRLRLPISESHLFSFLTQNDRFDPEAVARSAEAIRQEYLKRGFVRAKVVADSPQVRASGDRVDVTFHIEEGSIYHVEGYERVDESDPILDRIVAAAPIRRGMRYQQEVYDALIKDLMKSLGQRGYLYADVRLIPKIDDVHHTVFLSFVVHRGQLTRLHRIHFLGNTRTSDEVLRREMRQVEGALVSVEQIEESLRRIRNLPFIRDAALEVVPSAEYPDRADARIHVKEDVASTEGRLSFGIETNGLIFGASLKQNNFLGTGRYASLEFEHHRDTRDYSLDYVNPYYTLSGISRGFHLYYHKINPAALGLAQYSHDTAGFSVDYNFPLNDLDSIRVGVGYNNVLLHTRELPSHQILEFVQNNGRRFNHGFIQTMWRHRYFDRSIFTTDGLEHVLSLEAGVPLGDHRRLDYYRGEYLFSLFQPLARDWILNLESTLGYGSSYGRTRGGLPFFKNFFAGGVGTVRGFDQGSLGPRDSDGSPLGGDTLMAGSAALIFPNPWSENLRGSLFVDVGNVYNLRSGPIRWDELRTSVGVGVEWRVPMLGPMLFSFGVPTKHLPGDRRQSFQFTVSTRV